MSHIIAFSKYLVYSIGGAEKSMRGLLREESTAGHQVTVCALKHASFLGQPLETFPLPNEWEVNWLEGYVSLKRFGFVEYVLNRGRLQKYVGTLSADCLWTYGFWAAATNGFKGDVVCYLRSETDLGLQSMTMKGFQLFLQCLYRGVEYPARRLFIKDIRRVAQNARVIANSRYMASLAWKHLGVRAEVVLPEIDIDTLRTRLSAQVQTPRYVVFVGDTHGKGLEIVEQVARWLPDLPFRVYSRFVSQARQDANMEWLPWQQDAWKVYRDAALVICPAQWAEAYGRVAREAYLLGIPVLVSRLGGLPEAVDEQADSLVDDFSNPKVWARTIKLIMNNMGDRASRTN